MIFNQEELQNYCKYILRQERIRDRILILCEGKILKEEVKASRSPESYQTLFPQSKQEENATPDSSFYKKCIPDSWFQFDLAPKFFNCGSCDDVIKIYLTLSEILSQDLEEKYVHPKEIFAIIDLDNQIRKINNYQFKSTQEIFFNLYKNTKINPVNAEANHKIWVTGLIHKEAYFLIPELQSFFDKYKPEFLYKNTKLSLEEIYHSMIIEIEKDKNLAANLEIIRPRIKNCLGLDFDDLEQLKNIWLNLFQNETNENKKRELIFSLLTVIKVKDNYWKDIKPEQGVNAHQYREQLELEIASKFYAKQTDNEAAAKYHIPYFFKMLRKVA
jgi:hypothetical protein